MKDNKIIYYQYTKSFKLPEEDDRITKLKDANYSKVLVITEDWCGDAMI